MKTLHRYLLRQVVATLLLTAAVFTAVLLIGNVLREILPLLLNQGATVGIFARALKDGEWKSVDIYELDYTSLIAWLRSRGGDNPWAESTVAILLGHEVTE